MDSIFLFMIMPEALPDLLKSIGHGVLAGVMAAGLGWLKNGYKSGERFEIKYAVPTVMVGAIVGIVGALKGFDIAQASDWVVQTGVIVVADMAWKLIWRNGGVALVDALKSVKDGAGSPPTPPPAQ